MSRPDQLLRLCLVMVTSLGFNATDVDAASVRLPYVTADKIAPELRAAAAHGATVDALLILRDQADLAPAELVAVRTARVAFVHRTVHAVATATQAPLRALLDALAVRYRAYAIVNAIAVEDVTLDVLQRLAARDDVAEIESDLPVRIDLPGPVAAPAATQAPLPPGIEWGVVKINAPELWALGHRGGGVVYASADTGVQWDHPALKTHYRGWRAAKQKAKHAYSWWDAVHSDSSGNGTNPCGFDSPTPCDDNGHGTHVMGTGVGDDKLGNQIGVAPRAKWIACRNMEEGFGKPSRYLECFDFFLAPWDAAGLNPDPARAPHVISNSWSCTASEGCVPRSLRKAVKAARAAGIFVVASAGNSGSACSSIATPPAIYPAATTVGATDANDALASFSSRGPVTIDGSGRRKPDLAAPGVSVRSSVPHDGYGVLSGTSMAAPHVAGAVALLWSARPDLRGEVGVTEQALHAGANPAVSAAGTCGGTTSADIPNDLFGYGRLDVAAALQALP
ncbi:S8 family serine peptidase [Candidatus Binatia bacterium]|nr:S8 family serine peptidase [Candidatus Binatia bacterium]